MVMKSSTTIVTAYFDIGRGSGLLIKASVKNFPDLLMSILTTSNG